MKTSILNLTLILFILISCDDSEIMLDPNDESIEIIIKAPAQGTTVYNNPGDPIEFTGEVSGITGDLLSRLEATWISDKDGLLTTGSLDQDGLMSFATNQLSHQTHHIIFEISDGATTLFSDTARVLNGNNISFENLQVGQRSIYQKSIAQNWRLCSLEDKRDDGIHAMEVAGMEDGVYTIYEYELPRGYNWRREYELKIENDAVHYFEDYRSYPLYCCFRSKSLPLNEFSTNTATIDGWCTEVDRHRGTDEVIYGYVKDYTTGNTTYPHLNVINDFIGSASDGPISYVAYNGASGIIRYSAFGYEGDVAFFYELVQ